MLGGTEDDLLGLGGLLRMGLNRPLLDPLPGEQYMQGRFNPTLGQGAQLAAEVLPIIGDARAIEHAQGADVPWWQKGLDYASLIPALGDVARLGGAALPLALGSLRVRNANEVLRQSKWDEVAGASRNAGIKRQPSTGRYIGGPKGATSTETFNNIVNQYIIDIQNALDSGIDPGYFYRQGRDTFGALTESPAAHERVAKIMGPTSKQEGPYTNLNYTIRALDQYNTGVPVRTGHYPEETSATIEAILAGEDPFLGFKAERYANRLGPYNPRLRKPAQLPPKDQWEWYSVGGEKGKVPQGATQVAFVDEVARQARNKINEIRKAEGLRPLSPEEVQELHWAAVRSAPDAPTVGPKDTIQGSAPMFAFQDSWEANPGKTTGMSLNGVPLEQYSEDVFNVMGGAGNKDRLVSGMGGEMQYPMIQGQGVYLSEVSPGMQSRPLVSITQGNGLDPASYKLRAATSQARQYMLGQDMSAGHIPKKAPSKVKSDTAEISIGRPPTRKETIELEDILNKKFGLDADGDPRTAIVFTEDGYRVLNLGAPDFAKGMHQIEPALGNAGLKNGKVKMSGRADVFESWDWSKGGITQKLLDMVDDPNYPGIAAHADSETVRAVAGEMADLYEKYRKAGMKDNQKLTNALRVWSTQGLPGLRQLVQQGLAPAALLGILSQLQPDTSAQPNGQL